MSETAEDYFNLTLTDSAEEGTVSMDFGGNVVLTMPISDWIKMGRPEAFTSEELDRLLALYK